jgi:nitronate monooxygenase
MPHAEIDTRIIAAPMAGGTSTPGFVSAVHRAGGLGFLAAGYKSADAVSAEIRACRDAGVRFGINVFVPDHAQLNPSPTPWQGWRSTGAALAGTRGAMA